MTTTRSISLSESRIGNGVSSRRLARLFAALSATNEAILRSTTVEEMLHKVAAAAVDGGGFLGSAIYRKEVRRRCAWERPPALSFIWSKRFGLQRIRRIPAVKGSLALCSGRTKGPSLTMSCAIREFGFGGTLPLRQASSPVRFRPSVFGATRWA
jgi:hypothetical protein